MEIYDYYVTLDDEASLRAGLLELLALMASMT